jgi:hypothetical protein
MAKEAKEAKERKLKPSEDKHQICKDLCFTLAQMKRFGDLIAIELDEGKGKEDFDRVQFTFEGGKLRIGYCKKCNGFELIRQIVTYANIF